MIYLLIGHRGAGKSSLLNRIQAYYKQESKTVQCIDLDKEIENRQGRSIDDIFRAEGEDYFREMERFQLREILNTFSDYVGDVYICLGAGFEGSQAEFQNTHVIWVRRETDRLGRIFLNRPRLNEKVSALEEYAERFESREQKYFKYSDEILTLQEGVESPNTAEKEFFFPASNLRASITVFEQPEKSFTKYIEKKRQWNLELELRDDLISTEQIKNFISSDSRKLFSFRNEPPTEIMLNAIAPNTRVDWPVELKQSIKLIPTFFSLHANNFSQVRTELTSDRPLKLAVTIETWNDLLEGHRWWLADKKNRAFLPLSSDGRWSWYRLWIGSQSLVNFVREGVGSASDQPTMLEWISSKANEDDFRKKGFAAVLGDPIFHSRTPVEQQEFFAQFRMPVFAIRVAKHEWSEALPILRELGLKAAAVTAPLKELAFQSCNETSDLARTFESVNTLLLKNGKWIGENTDLGGFQKIAVNRKQSAVIWGGGGTLEVTRLMVPQASLYSAQTGEVRPGGKPFPPAGSPNNIVWSVSRSHYLNGNAKWPPPHWRPQRVIDLNYTDDSPGLEYAAMTGAEYVSGLVMFKEQARLQREFWSQHLNPSG